jgi:CubicO group peptidase (beta-lactamase class C family)
MKYFKSKSFLLIAFFCLFSCVSEHSQDNSEIANSAWVWPISTPEMEGINPEVLDSIHADILEGQYGLVDHMLLIRNGNIVVDKHYGHDYLNISKQYDTANHQYNYDHPDWHPYYNNSDLHTIQSVTKSITSILVGIAVDEGLLAIHDTTIMSLFSDYQLDYHDIIESPICVEDLLTMRSGIRWDEEDYTNPNNNCTKMELSNYWVEYVLNQAMDSEPGTEFVYNGGNTVLLGKIIYYVTGMRIDQWAEEKLFQPLGITDYYWKESPDGEIDTEGGLYLKPHDLAKIGLLMLNEGQFADQQILSKQWVERSIEPISQVTPFVTCGYVWWGLASNEDSEVEVYAALGFGGQYIMVAPRYDMLVVFNCWNAHDQMEKYPWFVLQELIIPNTEL